VAYNLRANVAREKLSKNMWHGRQPPMASYVTTSFSIKSTLKLYCFKTVEDRGINSAMEMLTVIRGVKCTARGGRPQGASP